MSRLNAIFVDTDAFVALAKSDDANHARAVHILDGLTRRGVLFRTSNYVFLEAVTVISQRVSHDAAMSFIQTLCAPASPFPVRWVTEELHARAVRIFSAQTSKNVSLVDCANMALMQEEKMEAIFSFDSIYKKNGFQTVAE